MCMCGHWCVRVGGAYNSQKWVGLHEHDNVPFLRMRKLGSGNFEQVHVHAHDEQQLQWCHIHERTSVHLVHLLFFS